MISELVYNMMQKGVILMALEQSKVQVNIPDDLVPIVNSLGVGTSLDDRVRLSLTIGLFASKAVSLAQAAQLSGRSLLDFMEILRSRGLHWGEYTEEQQSQDDESLRKLLDQMGAVK